MVILSVDGYLRNVIKQPEILTTIHINTKKSGLDKMTNEEIDKEISDHRKSKFKD